MVANLAEAKTHTLPPATFLQHDQAIQIARREHEDTGAALARANKAAKAAAVDLKAYKIMQTIDKLDDDEQIIVVRHLFDYMGHRGMPVGTQYSLIDAPKVPNPGKAKLRAEVAVFEAGENGLRAGRAGDPSDINPHDPGSEPYVAWARSYAQGLSERATAAGMEDTENERVADNAPATKKAAQGRGGARKTRGSPPRQGAMMDSRANGGTLAH
jgi:hypothetical protein